MRHFWKITVSVFLFCVILSQISLTVFAATPTESVSTEDIATTSVAAGTTDPMKHDPVTDIFDGAIYYLRNAANGTYMDVDNEETESGTNISTYQFHGKPNQQFRLHYIGKNLYELNPMNSPTMCVRAAEYADGTNVDMHYSSNTRTRFRVTPLGGGKYTLCSESRNFTDAICFDTARPNNVVQKNYANLGNKEYAQWYLERASSTQDTYERFYFRNVNTGLYLDAEQFATTNGTIIHARTFLGQENGQFRKIYDSTTDAYKFVPMHYTNTALYVSSTANLQLYGSKSVNSRFRLEAIGTDSVGQTTYRIRTSCSNYTEYLNIGDPMERYPGFYYVKSGTDENDLWVFERALFNDPDTRHLDTNVSFQTTITPYHTTVLTHQTTSASRFKFEVFNSVGASLTVSIYDNLTATQPAFCRTITSTSTLEVIDVFLAPKHTYYCTITNNSNGTYTFPVRVRQFMATYHSNNQNDLTANEGIANLLGYSNRMNWYVDNKPNMTVDRAKQETNPITGERDFNSEIFIYSGHGYTGGLSYEGGLSAFLAKDLPNMSNCELAIFGSCDSAASTLLQKSMVQQSLKNGAKSAIGWSKSIGNPESNSYLYRFLDALRSGYTIWDASQFATEDPQFTETNTIISSLVVDGDTTRCLFPLSEINATNVNTAECFIQNSAILSKDKYTLVAYNKNCGVKLYTRMINGIPSDDFYMDYFDSNGNHTRSWKSPNTLSEKMFEALETANAISVNQKTETEKACLVYSCKNGVWQLTTKGENIK